MQMFCEVDTTYLPFSNCYHFATKHEQKKNLIGHEFILVLPTTDLWTNTIVI